MCNRLMLVENIAVCQGSKPTDVMIRSMAEKTLLPVSKVEL